MRKQYNEKLTMRFMCKHQPFETLPSEYFSGTWPTCNPPMFLYGFPFPYDGDFDAFVDFLQAMQEKTPHEEWKDSTKWGAVDAICKYAEAAIDTRSNVTIRLLESDVEANADIHFIFYFYTSRRPSEPKAPEWLPSVAQMFSEVFAELGWEAPEAKWYMHITMGAYEDSRDFN